MAVKVWNKREPNVPADAVYVGRPTKWGNPFTHLQGNTRARFQVATREDAIAAYRHWLNDNQELLDALHELRGKHLVCWCAPLLCHADVLLREANHAEVLVDE